MDLPPVRELYSKNGHQSWLAISIIWRVAFLSWVAKLVFRSLKQKHNKIRNDSEWDEYSGNVMMKHLEEIEIVQACMTKRTLIC